MTSVDIICGILLLYGVWRGWSKGVIVQLSGIIGLLLGGYLAWHYSEPVGRWIGVALLLYVLINTYESANQVRHWTSNKGIEQSFLYKPIKEVGELAFPYLQELRDQVLGS